MPFCREFEKPHFKEADVVHVVYVGLLSHIFLIYSHSSSVEFFGWIW